jgi:hypothetical protein
MDTLVVILIVAAAIVLALAFVRIVGQRRRERTLDRDRLGRQVTGHRQQAESLAAKADDLAPQAEEHRFAAEEHVAQARELEDEAARLAVWLR